jgi:phosphatidylglycerophosphate synthase
VDLDAIVLADSELAAVRIAGLSVRERAIRVATRVGAKRVHVIDDAAARAQLVSWRGASSAALLVIRADQLVHTPLCQPLAAWVAGGGSGAAITVGNTVEDSPDTYAGAFVVTAGTAGAVCEALARGETDTNVVATLHNATRIPHGAIARHAVGTAAERDAAHRLLYKILIKPQDNAITRYLYRPVSFPLTRLLVWTPITPNQVSYLVGIFVAIGCWVTAHASFHAALLGTVIVLAASYLDCCDGEIARLKLTSSKLGAWLDTIIDELSSLGYMLALGWHCRLAFGTGYFGALPFDPWLVGMAIGAVTYSLSIYLIYYNIIVAVGSANSQDYARFFHVVPGTAPNAVRLAVTPPVETIRELPKLLRPIVKYGPNIVRRDFISWGVTFLAAVHLTQLSFVLLVGFGVPTIVVLVLDHVRLRTLRRSITRGGQVLEAPLR